MPQAATVAEMIAGYRSGNLHLMPSAPGLAVGWLQASFAEHYIQHAQARLT